VDFKQRFKVSNCAAATDKELIRKIDIKSLLLITGWSGQTFFLLSFLKSPRKSVRFLLSPKLDIRAHIEPHHDAMAQRAFYPGPGRQLS
jgi:hypothetical protein